MATLINRGTLTSRRIRTIGFVLSSVLLSVLVFVLVPRTAFAEEGVTRIHVLSLVGSDAIVIESDGRFGMVDSGESDDYPDGSDPRYPFRPGTTIGCGTEDQVLAYLDSLGVTEDNFDFYIGTHPHSDHIGTAGMVIRKYKPSKVYTPRYDDSYMTSSWGLWDNRYVYDKLVNAANEVGAELYLDFDEKAPEVPESGSHVCRPQFDFGSAHIDLVNIDSAYEIEGTSDANHISLGVKVTSNGEVAYLAGDICNTDGDEERLAQTLGHVDFMKLGHHGNNEANTYAYVMALSPDIVFQTRVFEWLWDQPLRAIQDLGCLFYNSEELISAGIPAFVVTLGPNGIETNMGPTGLSLKHNHYTGCYEAFDNNRPANKLEGWYKVAAGYVYFNGAPSSLRSAWINQDGSYSYVGNDALMATGWMAIDGRWYYFDSDGVMQTGWRLIDGVWYWFDESGAMATGLVSIDGVNSNFSEDGSWLGYTVSTPGWNRVGGTWYYISDNGQIATGWLKRDGRWYWLDSSGGMASGWREIRGCQYHFDASGAMSVGWSYIGGSWYLFDASGAMLIGWVNVDSNWYLLSESGAMETGWVLNESTWYWLDASGAMKTGWLSQGGKWYWLAPASGDMKTGWQFVGGRWYFFDRADGTMKTGWLYDVDNNWYYLAADGVMQSSSWIGDYYVLDNGMMAINQWVGQYYVGSDGRWIA